MKRNAVRTMQAVAVILVAVCSLSGVSHAVTTKPLNDNFANAQLISANAGTVAGTNVGATKETGEPNPGGNAGGKSVWFRWVAPNSGTAMFDTVGSDFDTLLAVYTGSHVSALTPVASNDDITSLNKLSAVTFPALGGVTYFIAVDGYPNPKTGQADNGNITLNWTLPPPNDNFANAQTLTGTRGSIKGTTLGATIEPGVGILPPNQDGTARDGRDVWYRFASRATGFLMLPYPSQIQVYSGPNSKALTLLRVSEYGYSKLGYVTVRAGSVLYLEVLVNDRPGPFDFSYRFIADATAPTIAFTRPTANSFITDLVAITGTVADNSGASGVAELYVYLRRDSDNKYWDGLSEWVGAPTALFPEYRDGHNWSLLDRQIYSGDYNLLYSYELSDGSYTIQAVATDIAGNRSVKSIQVTKDQTPPTGSIAIPANNATVANLNSISGRATDAVSGIKRVDLLIQRRSDGKFWTGTDWQTKPRYLATMLGAGVWTRNAGNPSGAALSNGSYNLFANIYDRAMNVTQAQNQITVRKTATVASATRLSTATASVADNSVQLKFHGALDPESASDATHYRVTVNGRAVAVESAGYNAGAHSVTLALPEGSLRSGDQVVVTLTGVMDAQGEAVVAQKLVITAQ